MSFLSYSLNFYRQALQALKETPSTPETIYRARQLLKLLDDLADEGYTELNRQLEAAHQGVSFLRAYLKQNHAEPFPLPEKAAPPDALSYAPEEIELSDAVQRAMKAAANSPAVSPAPFIHELRRFCDWIGYEDDTAYIFLLRDTLLPLAFFLGQGRTRVYPWLLSRKSFAELTGAENADDEIRAAVYRALEAGCADFPSFARLVLPDIRETIGRYPKAEACLRGMLAGIDAKKLRVVESGCCGTFPLLLMSLDDRADMRMYTTYPYLANLYAPRVYTARYEENRLFETMLSQEAYLRYSGFRNGRFYVQKCMDADLERLALSEIKAMQTKEDTNA